RGLPRRDRAYSQRSRRARGHLARSQARLRLARLHGRRTGRSRRRDTDPLRSGSTRHLRLPLQRLLRQRTRRHGRHHRGEAMIEKRIAGVLLSGAASLLVEVRFEHREVLGETWRGWIPLAWAALVIAAGVPAWLAWARGG